MNGKKKYFKHGNPELSNYFTDEQIKTMSERESAMWTPEGKMDEKPISLEVLNFQNEQDKAKIEELEKEIESLNKQIGEYQEQLDEANAENGKMREAILSLSPELMPDSEESKKPDPLPEGYKTENTGDDLGDSNLPKTDEEAEKKLVQEELRKLGVRFAYNTGLPKLKEKLKEAQDAADSK